MLMMKTIQIGCTNNPSRFLIDEMLDEWVIGDEGGQQLHDWRAIRWPMVID